MACLRCLAPCLGASSKRVQPAHAGGAADSNGSGVGEADVLACGAEVQYRNAQGACEPVRVVGVHYDDEQPYYSILLSCGTEKQTVRDRLHP